MDKPSPKTPALQHSNTVRPLGIAHHAPGSLLIRRPGAKPVLLPITPQLQITGPLPAELRPRFGVVRFQTLPDGTLKPVLRTQDEWVRMTENLPRDLGLSISNDTLKRLCRSGIVLWRQITPGGYELNLHSLDAHLQGCANDPEYWDTKVAWPDGRTITRRQKFKEGL